MSRIPELRVADIEITTGDNDTFDAGGGSATVSEHTYDDILDLNSGSAGAPAECEAAAETALSAGCTFSYNDTGSSRGKFTWAKNSGTWTLGDDSTDLISYFGFTESSYAAAQSHTSDRPSPYIFTPEYGLRDSNGVMDRGIDWDVAQADATQVVTGGGVVSTLSGNMAKKRRTVTFTALAKDDVQWFYNFWNIARDGRKLLFFQDRTVTTGYDEDDNQWGYLAVVFDEATCQGFVPRKTFPSTPNMYDITIGLLEYNS